MITTFRATELPNMATHCSQEMCGFSIYRGVLVQWDEDHDERVLTVLDKMPAVVVDQLLVIQEHEAVLGLIWDRWIPNKYVEGVEVEVEGDVWRINSSRLANGGL